MSNEFIVKYRPFNKDECCFDIVAGNNVEATFDRKIVRLVAFDDVASTLLLVWTGLKRYLDQFSGFAQLTRVLMTDRHTDHATCIAISVVMGRICALRTGYAA